MLNFGIWGIVFGGLFEFWNLGFLTLELRHVGIWNLAILDVWSLGMFGMSDIWRFGILELWHFGNLSFLACESFYLQCWSFCNAKLAQHLDLEFWEIVFWVVVNFGI